MHVKMRCAECTAPLAGAALVAYQTHKQPYERRVDERCYQIDTMKMLEVQ